MSINPPKKKHKRKPRGRGYWQIKENCLKVARLCKSRSEFAKRYRGASASARVNGWYDEACEHMVLLRKPRGYWTKGRCLKIARGYKHRQDFREGDYPAYLASKRHGWVDDICQHMNRLHKPNGYWTKERCHEIALRYKTRTEFQQREKSVYNTAHQNGWVDDICTHMHSVGNMVNRCVYVIKSGETKEIYIGITFDFYGRSHKRPLVADLRDRGEYIQITEYIDAEDAVKIEKILIAKFKNDPEWDCLNISDGGGLGYCRGENARREQSKLCS